MSRPFRLGFSLLLLWILCQVRVQAQEFIPLWPKKKMPNSKGLKLEDKIENERITQVGTPGMYAFYTSKEENKGCAVLICPSGGYQKLTYLVGGTQLAKWLNTLGITAFVLNYRLPNSPDLKERSIGPEQDAQRAMRLIRANATKWQLDPNRIGIMGASAGVHLASTLGTHQEDVSAIGDELDKLAFAPNFMVLVSPVITLGQYAHVGSRNTLLGENAPPELVEKFSNELHVSEATPPTFLVHAYNDPAVNQRNSLLFYQALVEHKVPGTLHIFPQGAHAIAVRNNPGSANQWTTLCEAWLLEMGFITEKK
ncbi:alpha/beta hydrolase [Hymenobacter norwichensis]|uniref:alpha/beta hydrolase n=1 Tax=Hymenobacter norwichensis TaxID=223903 RepID=UPI0003B53CDA|nr:alpha/beta hydrolase [Hymenobacter norwichensis]